MSRLKPYVGRMVMLQLKQPYMLQMSRAERGDPAPLSLVVNPETGAGRLATPDDAHNVQPLAVDILVGKVVERAGSYVVQFKDQTSDKKMEIDLADEFVMAVSTVSEDRILIS